MGLKTGKARLRSALNSYLPDAREREVRFRMLKALWGQNPQSPIFTAHGKLGKGVVEFLIENCPEWAVNELIDSYGEDRSDYYASQTQ